MTPGVAARAPISIDEASPSVWVSRWLYLVAALVVVMVAVGGATRLTDSGLSITEWKPLLGAIPPLSAADWADAFAKYKTIPQYAIMNKGMSLAEFKEIYWWEWGHRFLGRFIGLVYALPLLAFWMTGAIPKGFKLPLVGVLALGALQGFVGWYMVQSGLTERIDVSQYRLALHLTIAFLLLGWLVWLALAVQPRDPLQGLQSVALCARLLAGVLLALVLLQVVLGAFVAGTKAGLTYNTWPLMDGDLFPSGRWDMRPWHLNLSENITAIQFNHRMVAYVLVLLAAIQAIFITGWSERPGVRVSAWMLAAGMFVQAGLGIWTLLAADGQIPLHLGITHQTAAAVIFAIAVWHFYETGQIHRGTRAAGAK